MCNTRVRPSAIVTWNTWSAASISAGNSIFRGWASRTSACSSQAAKSVMKALNSCLSGLSVSAMTPAPQSMYAPSLTHAGGSTALVIDLQAALEHPIGHTLLLLQESEDLDHDGLVVHHRPSTCACTASVWGSQKV